MISAAFVLIICTVYLLEAFDSWFTKINGVRTGKCDMHCTFSKEITLTCLIVLLIHFNKILPVFSTFRVLNKGFENILIWGKKK